MPGFFVTFILLCFAGGWARFLSHRSGRLWPMALPAAGLVIWCLLILIGVFTAAGMEGGGVDLEGNGLKLNRVIAAAQYARYLAIAVLIGLVPTTGIVWLRPATTAGKEPG